MRNSDFELPSQKLISALDLSPLNWGYLPLDDGFADTAATTLAWDDRCNALADLTLSGTVSAAWSDLPGWLRANNSIFARKNVSDDAEISSVFDFVGKTLLIGFQALVPYGTGREVVLHVGGGVSQTEYGLTIVREANGGRFAALMKGDAGTAVTQTSKICGDLYAISGVTAGATPTITVTHATRTTHKLIVGEKIYLSNCNDTTLADGIYTVASTPGAMTFTIDATENGGSNATGDGTSGAVGPKCNVLVAIDGVSKTMQIWINQVGDTAWGTASTTSYSTIADPSFSTNTPRISLFAGDGASPSDKLQLGAIRRLLVLNYGAQTLASAVPELTTKIMPALSRSQMRPCWELVP